MESAGRGDRGTAKRRRERGTARRPVRTTLSALVAAAALASSATGHAAPPAAPPSAASEPTPAEIAAARQLFNQGKELEKGGAWTEALAKFRKVAEVKMTPQVRFHLALCQEKLGQLVEAMNGFELAMQEASQLHATEVLDNAPKRLEALRQRIARLRIEVTGDIDGTRVLLDGKALAPALVGTEIPVDPGAHTVELRRGDDVLLVRNVTLAERDMRAMKLEAEPPRQLPSGLPPAQARVPAPPRAITPAPSGSRTPAILAGGAGLLALAGAGVLFGLRESAIAAVRDTCDPGTIVNCSPGARSDFERSKTYTTVAAVLAGAGAAGLATATVLWFTLPPKSAAARGTRVQVAPQGSGVRITVVF